MNKTPFLSGKMLAALCVCALLTACGNDYAPGTQSQRLPACSAEGSIFADTPFDEWADLYHGKVSAAVESHLDTLRNASELPLQCTAEEYADVVPATTALREIAAYLPGYREGNKLESLNEADIGAVMLEFLRVYECSMLERKSYLLIRIPQEEGTMMSWELLDIKKEQEQKIDDELNVSRATMEKTMALVGGYDRLRPLALDVECIKRASLDLRNVLGLASDASSCLPKAWDTHGSLRDLAE